ncbi:MAG: hypothetical protein H7A53_09215 [Akkermansiaceae bacterium]|nr:hypothetical protein [Akkermansiaceae bacterium]
MDSWPYFLTFYSYKGGVGRSMALMNCAWQLAAWGRHVLMVDMDLEAPGLSGFLERSGSLAPRKKGSRRADLLDLLIAFRDHPAPEPINDENALLERLEAWEADLPNFERHLRSIDQSDWPDHLNPKAVPVGRIDLLGVDEDRSYTERLAACGIREKGKMELERLASSLRWLIASHTFDTTLPEMAEFGESRESPYDYVLIDSRTGITEIGGACLGPLSDGLVVLVGLNDQNIEGTRMVLTESGILPVSKKNRTTSKTAKRKKPGKSDAVTSDTDSGDFPPSKPTVLVTSPVPTGEIEYKQRRLEIIRNRIGEVRSRLSYHPLMALEETSFVAKYPEEYLANEYRSLARELVSLAGESAASLDRSMWDTIKKEDWVRAIHLAIRICGLVPYANAWRLREILNDIHEKKIPLSDIQAFFHTGSRLSPNEEWLFNLWGNALSAQGKTRKGMCADRLFKAAGDKYEHALALNPESHHALSNWGIALSERAGNKNGAAAERLLKAAGDKHKQALAIKPDFPEALNNLGWVLLCQARSKEGSNADRLFKAACDKFEQALAIKPDFGLALNNWGGALRDQAITKTGDEADRLFKAACDKYGKALAIKPDYHEALYNWGIALSDQAETKTGDEADRLFKAACDKYGKALAIKPDDHEALNNWGNALLDQAKTKTGDEADRLFKAAGDKYGKALAIKPDDHEVLSNLGNALSDQAKTKTGDEADRLFKAAGDKYGKALAIKPENTKRSNWGQRALGPGQEPRLETKRPALQGRLR